MDNSLLAFHRQPCPVDIKAGSGRKLRHARDNQANIFAKSIEPCMVCSNYKLEEEVGFEPTTPEGEPVFGTGALTASATLPNWESVMMGRCSWVGVYHGL